MIRRPKTSPAPRVTAILVLLLSSSFAHANNEPMTAAGCMRDISRVVSALVSRAPLVMADLQVGKSGETHPMVAQALGVEAEGRTTNEDGLVLPSPVEQELADRIADDPCFRAFERIVAKGAEDVSGVNRAVMQIEVPFADYRELTVEYAPGEFRRNHLFQLSLGFELRDANGKVVFARSFADHSRRACFWKGKATEDGSCVDFRDARVDRAAEWLALIEESVGTFLEGVSADLVTWHALLADVQGEFFDRRYSQDRDVDAVQVRNRDALALPYLFVQTPTPRVNIRGLLSSLEERGYASMRPGEMQNHFNILFRSYLDRSLHVAFANRSEAANARVVLLSDAQSQAFQNATIVSCAEQSRGFNREDCLEPVKLIERLCDAKSPGFRQHRNPRGDDCMLASLAFGNSLTRANDESLGAVRSAQQRVQAASYLRSADEPRSKTRVSCINPEAEEMQGHVVGISDEYYRIDNAVQNDDSIYLVDAAVDGLRQQADCLASSILDRYQAMLNPEPETRTE